jgi:hypothetical protein
MVANVSNNSNNKVAGKNTWRSWRWVMSWQLVLAACSPAVLISTLVFLSLRDRSPDYQDLTAGYLIFQDGSKAADFGFVLSLILSFSGVLLLLSVVGSLLERRHGTGVLTRFYGLLVYASLPLVATFAQLFLGDLLAFSPINYAVVFTGLVVGFSALSLRKPLTADRYAALVGTSSLTTVLSWLTGIAVILLVNRINPAHPWVTVAAAQDVATYAFTITLLLLVASWLGLGERRARLETRLHALLMSSQLSLPLLYVVLIPTPWELAGERWFGYDTTVALPLLITVIISLAYAELATKARRSWDRLQQGELWQPNESLAALAIGAVLVFIKFSSIALPYISGDDYHFGENLLPYWTLTDGALPFIDHVPAHGLMNYLPGLFANLFFDGSAGTYNAAMSLAAAGFLLLGYWLLARAIGVLPALLAFLLMPLDIEIRRTVQFAFTAVLCLLAEPRLRVRPSVWLVAWGVLGFSLFLYVSGQGSLLIIATFPLALWMLYRAFREEPKRLGYTVLGVLAVVGVLLTATDLLPIVWGALRYGLENSAVYEAAYAVPWADRFYDTRPLNRWLWEVLRVSWLFVAALAVVLTVRTLVWQSFGQTSLTGEENNEQAGDNVDDNNVEDSNIGDNVANVDTKKSTLSAQSTLLFVSVPIALLLLLLIPYALGRIDQGFSRAGVISAWSMSTLLPLLLIRAFPKRLPTILLITTLAGGLLIQSNLGVATRPARLLRIASYAIDTSSVTLTNGEDIGLPRLGTVIMAERDLHRLRNLDAVLSQVVRDGETYLDMTNRNAHYFYLGMEPPIEVGALYNLPNSAQQARAVRELAENPPPIVLAQARNISHDGGSNALRAHLVYRFVVENYIPIAIGQHIYMVRPDRYSWLEKYLERTTNTPLQLADVDEEGAWQNGVRVSEEADAPVAVMLKRDIVTVAPGDTLLFASGARTVARVEEQTLWLEGAPLDPVRDGYPNDVGVRLQQANDESRLALLDEVFRQANLRRLPIAWADAYDSLQSELVPVLDLDAEGIVQLRGNTEFFAPNQYLVSGTDPGVTYYFPAQDIAARDAGILRFDFTCFTDRPVEPQLEIFFSGDDMPDPKSSMRALITPRNGTMLVPLDAYPRWLRLEHAKQIRFDVTRATLDSELCDGFEVSNVQLYQRRSVRELDVLQAPLFDVGRVSAVP